MLINNIDIVDFKALLTIKDIQTVDVVTYDSWLRNALNPLYLGKTEQFKKINIQLVISDIDDNGALNNISNLIKQLEKCTVKFDDIEFYYDCTIANKSNEKITNGFYLLDVELKSGYAYKTAVTETLDHVASKVITVLGNLPTPAIVTITAPINTISLILNGLGDSITVNNLLANVPVIIDGENCKVMSNGLNKFADVDMWSFPTLNPNINTITVNNSNCVVMVQYKPKYI